MGQANLLKALLSLAVILHCLVHCSQAVVGPHLAIQVTLLGHDSKVLHLCGKHTTGNATCVHGTVEALVHSQCPEHADGYSRATRTKYNYKITHFAEVQGKTQKLELTCCNLLSNCRHSH